MGTEISGSTGIDKIQNDAVDIADLSATGTASASTFLRGDNTWTDALPTQSGNAGKFLTTDASTASWAEAGGLYSSIAMICDQKAYDVTGGAFTSGAWRTRDLNTEVSDADGIVSIASNQFTLQAGTYTIEWLAPAYNVRYHLSKLVGITSLGDSGYGTANRTGTAGGDTGQDSNGMAVVTLSGAEAFEIQHQCETTRTYGFGSGQNSLDSGTVNIYTQVKILKHS